LGRGVDQGQPDHLEHILRLAEHVAIPEPKNAPSELLKPLRPTLIVIDTDAVLATVHFDDEAR
jgi:hypothetical protein